MQATIVALLAILAAKPLLKTIAVLGLIALLAVAMLSSNSGWFTVPLLAFFSLWIVARGMRRRA